MAVSQRIVLEYPKAMAQVLTAASSGQHQINTAFSERSNVIFHASLAPLAHHTRALTHSEAVLSVIMCLVGTVYTFVWCHESLRLGAERQGLRWQDCTPAKAAGLTDHP